MKHENSLTDLRPDFGILDGLRGIAAVYVVLFHCRGQLLMGGSAYANLVPIAQWSMDRKLIYSFLQLTTLGREFVIFFFVLSGFSITHSLTKNKKIIPFYTRRIIRLYPPYLFSLVWAAFIFWIVTRFAPDQLGSGERSVFSDWIYFFRNIFYLNTGGLITAQYWSLSLEVIFYLLIPYFFIRGLGFYIAVSVIGYIIGWFVPPDGPIGSSIPGMFFLYYNLFFAIGIVLYKYYNKIKQLLLFRKSVFVSIAGTLFVAMVIIRFKLGGDNKITLAISSVFAVLMILHFLEYKVSNSVLLFFGKMSYTIYITHLASMCLFFVILQEMGFPFHLKISEFYIWPIGVLFCLVMAIPLYYLGEYPTKKILKSMRKTSQSSGIAEIAP